MVSHHAALFRGQLRCALTDHWFSHVRDSLLTVCELPVAKRNFVKRHGHGLVNSAKELRETVDRMVPSLQSQSSISPIAFNSPIDYSSCHEVSSDEDNEDATKLTPFEHRRAVSFDETIFATQPSTDPSFGLSTNEDLWLPSVQNQPTTRSCDAEHVPIHVVQDPSTAYNHLDIDPINVVQDVQQGHTYAVVPPSPPLQACTVSVDIEAFYEFYPKVVPLVEPGASITEWEFEEAIYGIDFSKVFD